jgi:hypothetical protein
MSEGPCPSLRVNSRRSVSGNKMMMSPKADRMLHDNHDRVTTRIVSHNR